jgi:hypothetical protein
MTSNHFDERRWFDGYKPNQADFDGRQDEIESAVTRIQKTYGGPGALSPVTAAGQAPASMYVGIGALTANDMNGRCFGFDSTQLVDCSVSTAGSLIGSTAPASSGNKRYIVIAGKHIFVNSDPRVDKHGNTIQFQKNSSFELVVYQTGDVATADNKYQSSTLDTLVAAIKSDGRLPLVVAERAFGATTLSTSNLYIIAEYVTPEGSHPSNSKAVSVHLAHSALPSVHTANAIVAYSLGTSSGTAGTVTITGGEKVSIGWNDPVNDEIKMITVTVPNIVLTLTTANKNYIVRMKLDQDRTPVVYLAQIYSGTGNYGDNSDPDANQYGTSQSGATTAGFRPTILDIPLLQVNGGALNTTPSAIPIPVAAVTRLNALEATFATTSTTIGVVRTDVDRLLASRMEFREILWGGQISLQGSGSTISFKVEAGAALFSDEIGGSNQRIIQWSNTTLSGVAVTNSEYILQITYSGVLSLVTGGAFGDGTATNYSGESVPLCWMNVRTLGGQKSIVQTLWFGNRLWSDKPIDWYALSSNEGGNELVLAVAGGIHRYPGGRKIVLPQNVGLDVAACWVSGSVENIVGGGGSTLGMRYMYLVPVRSAGVAPTPADKGIICRVKLSSAAPNAHGFHPDSADSGLYYPFFGSLPCRQIAATDPSIKLLQTQLRRTNGWVWYDNNINNSDSIIMNQAFGDANPKTSTLSSAQLPLTAKEIIARPYSIGLDNTVTVSVQNLVEGSAVGLVSSHVYPTTKFSTTIIPASGPDIHHLRGVKELAVNTLSDVQFKCNRGGSVTAGDAGIALIGYREDLCNPYSSPRLLNSNS